MSEIVNNLKHPELNKFHEELAKTYFSKNTSKEDYFTQPQASRKNERMRKIVFPAIILLLALSITAIFMFLKKVEVNVNIYPYAKNIPEESINDNTAVYFNKNGEFNKGVIKNIIFYESASGDSSWGKDFITLSNEISSKRAVLGIDFSKPQNMSEKILAFYAKGKTGEEKLRLRFRDNKNDVCYSKISQLDNSWQLFAIDMEQAKDLISIEDVNHVDFEINPTEEQNISRSEAYFKDMRFTKREGL